MQIYSIVKITLTNASIIRSLRQIEERFRNLFEENSGVKLLIDTGSLDIINANKVFEEYFDIKRENILGKTNINLILEENAERINKIETQLLSEHNTVVYQSTVKIKRNMAIPILVYKSSFGLPGHKPEIITGT